ncbi:MAG: hypothetical protein RR945_05670 [Erysipelotrichaceae bacterium]
MENTSYIADISYQIENWLHQGHSIGTIRKFIKDLQNSTPPTFPRNLELINAYYDRFGGSSGCAFLDTNTGETIIGFAGTNQENGWEQTGNDFIADGIGLGISGISPNSRYMQKANDFINSLKNDGYNITQATGHSLGGALCVLAGLNHDIPLIITYNGAPLYGLATAELTGVASEIRKLYANYNGRIIRFVSNEDWLNPLGDSVSGLYYGEEYMLYNGQGHDLKFFKDSKEQDFINKIIQSTLNNQGELSVDFNDDKIPDISLAAKDLYVKNMFGVNGSYSGNGTKIEINPQAFYNLQQNLKNSMAEEDFNWIKDAVIKCDEKNELLKNNKELREDTLIQNIVMDLNSAGLPNALNNIEASHGALLAYKSTISSLSNFDTYSVTRKFDRWGSSGGRRWFLDGEEFDEYDLINWIKGLKEAASVVHHQITTTGEFKYYNASSSTYEIVKYDTLSDIGNAFVSVTNRFLEKSKKVFNGTGLRLGKTDGIVEAISEVFEFELKNIEEMKKKVESLSDIAGGLANNFSKMDSWLQEKINKGEVISGFDNKPISQDYKAYLQENEIFDDVKDVLEAYDSQVEEATSKLSKSIVKDYTDLIDRSYTKLSTIYSHFETFINAIDYLQEQMNKNVTSTRIKTTMVGYNEWESTEIKDYHGNLSSSFPSEVVSAIATAKDKINPRLSDFVTAINSISIFKTQISQIEVHFNTIIEQAIYNSMELDTIINAQMLVSLRIKRMKEEIIKIKQDIQEQYNGEALKSYQDMLSELIKLFEYFDSMLNDCFGTNL